MKITDKKTGGISKVSRGAGAQKRKTEEVETLASKDTVEISSQAQAVEAIRGLIETTPDIRTEQVARVVDMLQKGNYKIDYQRVAESFIRHVIEEEIQKKGKLKGEPS